MPLACGGLGGRVSFAVRGRLEEDVGDVGETGAKGEQVDAKTRERRAEPRACAKKLAQLVALLQDSALQRAQV